MGINRQEASADTAPKTRVSPPRRERVSTSGTARGTYSVNERTRIDSVSEGRIRLTLFSLAQLGPCLFDCIGSGNRNTDDHQVARAGVLERNNLGRAPGADGPSRKGEAVG